METIKFIILWPYFVMALFGTVAHIIAKLAKLEKEDKFSFKKWRKKNLFATILSIMLSLVGVYILQASGTLSLVAVFFMAWAGDSAIKNGQAGIKK